MRLRAARLLLALAAAGCAAPGPTETLDAYRRALESGDAEAAHALESARRRGLRDGAALRRALATPRAAGLIEALRDAAATGVTAELRLPSGARVGLVLEPEGWRVDRGGLDPDDASTPEAALRLLLRAVDDEDWGAVRSLIPAAFAARLADDAALRLHLEAVAPRIDSARGGLEGARWTIEADRAEAEWGDGRLARMVREGEQWKVLDLE